MIPKLSVNQQNLDRFGKTPDNPNTLRQWITQNIRGTLLERIGTLSDTMRGLQGTHFDNPRYLECLDVGCETARAMSRSVSRRYEGLPKPMPQRSIELSYQAESLWRQLADNYKACVLASAQKKGNPQDAMKDAHACYGAIHCLSRALYSAYEVYRKTPKNIWLEIHQLYLFALDRELIDLGIKSLVRDESDNDTVLDAYKRIVLLDLADPYQMPFSLTAKADDMISRLVDFASLRQVPLNDEIKGIFLIDPGLDKSGIPQISQIKLPLDNNCQLLCTLPLLARVHSHIDLLISTGADIWINPEKSARQVDYIAMLRSLIVKLGVQPVRSNPRPSTDKDCEIIAGTQKLTLLAHGQLPYFGKAELAKIDKTSTQSSASNSQNEPPAQTRTVVYTDPHANSWTVVDETVAGMQLETGSTVSKQLSVGEFIGIDHPIYDNSGWTIGLIRWIKSYEEERTTLGLLKLGWPAYPCYVRHPVEEEKQKLAGIYLPENDSLNRGQTLIIEKGFYKFENEALLTLGDDEANVKMGNLIIATPSGDCFEISAVS